MQTDDEIENVAKGVSAQQLSVLRVYIDKAFRSADFLHPKTLFKQMNEVVEVDYKTFIKQVCACVKTGRIVGFKTGKAGVIYRSELEDELKAKRDKAHRQAPVNITASIPSSVVTIDEADDVDALKSKLEESQQEARDDTNARSEIEHRFNSNSGGYKSKESSTVIVAGELYRVPMSSNDIKTLLIYVLDAKLEDAPEPSSCVEFANKKYSCDAKLFGKFLFYFFGAKISIGPK